MMKQIKTDKKMTNVIKQIIKWVLILLTLVIIISLVLNIIFVSKEWSYFFGFFQLHFNWNIWIIRIISIIFVFIFIFYILPNIRKIINPVKPLSKKQIPVLVIVCFLCILWFITYLAEKGHSFDGKGIGLIGKAWAVDHYEDVELHYTVHPDYGTPVIKVTPENIAIFSLRKIKVDDNTVFFNPFDGTPLVYYYMIGSQIDFFNSKGIHPQYGEELIPVTQDFIKNYFLQIEADKKKVEEELIKQQELEKQRQIETQELARQIRIQGEVERERALPRRTDLNARIKGINTANYMGDNANITYEVYNHTQNQALVQIVISWYDSFGYPQQEIIRQNILARSVFQKWLHVYHYGEGAYIQAYIE